MGFDVAYDCELRLGLPGGDDCEAEVKSNKRLLTNTQESRSNVCSDAGDARRGSSKAQIVGWPPIRSYRKNSLQQKNPGSVDSSGVYVKVSMDGAPYLRKIDLNGFRGYSDLLKALENMFKIIMGNYSESEGYKGSEYEPTYEDKDGDWMLVGDVPWDMFVASCKKLRIMRSSEATRLGSGM